MNFIRRIDERQQVRFGIDDVGELLRVDQTIAIA
ncbi:hypothetical protein HDG34_002484 [Paraburkholderia sp. HC6.4b]|nr:hypothetical protein [Paraburkholderia sp. HC6.4b]MBB5451653.1 hypothetical protein [Paraburkholderia sp. Kb1A]